MNSKINKLFSFALVTALIGTTLHCSATNIVPVNGGGGNVAVPPAAPVTKTTVDSKSLSRGFSLQMMKSKIDEVINPRRSEAQLRDNPSGKCGNDCSWSLDTSTGVLTISGTGEMTSHPWWNDYKDSIKSVTIENGVTSIGGYAFWNCSALTSVYIPNSVTSIGVYAFDGCSALKNVTIPDSVTSINYAAFTYCSALTNVTIPDSVTVISEHTFSYCSALKSVAIGNGITIIPRFTFSYCNSLTSIKIPDSVTLIQDHAFKFCRALKSVTLGNKVETIGSHAFFNCSALTSVTIPDSVTCIQDQAFENCSALSNVCYSGASDPGKSFSGVFSKCDKLTSVSVTETYTGSSFCGKPISQVDKCAVAGATLSAKPAMWFIAATALVVPAVVFSFLM